MCLHEIVTKDELTTTEQKNLNRGIGYKVFLKNANGLKSDCIHSRKGCYHLNQWIRDRKKKIISGGCCRYESGFHIFLSRSGAIDWGVGSFETLKKVSFKKANVIGKQCYFGVVVVRQMKINL